MNEKGQKNTAENSAVNEGTIYPEDLLQEILPLIKDYFVGSFEIRANAIEMKFLNGQQFRLSAGEVVG